MGVKLLKYFEAVNSRGGTQAQMRLAVMTGMTTAKAAAVPDNEENLSKFQSAAKEITGEQISI